MKLSEIASKFWQSLPESAKTAETQAAIRDAYELAMEDMEDGKVSLARQRFADDLKEIQRKAQS